MKCLASCIMYFSLSLCTEIVSFVLASALKCFVTILTICAIMLLSDVLSDT